MDDVSYSDRSFTEPLNPPGWKLPGWFPLWLRRWLHLFEPRNEALFRYYCMWAAHNRGFETPSNDWRIIAAHATIVADATGVSRLRLVRQWALKGLSDAH